MLHILQGFSFLISIISITFSFLLPQEMFIVVLHHLSLWTCIVVTCECVSLYLHPGLTEILDSSYSILSTSVSLVYVHKLNTCGIEL